MTGARGSWSFSSLCGEPQPVGLVAPVAPAPLAIGNHCRGKTDGVTETCKPGEEKFCCCDLCGLGAFSLFRACCFFCPRDTEHYAA